MFYISKKIRFVFLFLLNAVIFAFAGEGNLNLYGQLGFHKTQSAQTLGHGRFGLGIFAEGTGLNDIIDGGGVICAPPDGRQYGANPQENSCGEWAVPLGSYIGINAYPFVSLGLSEYFDFGISIPVYAEMIEIENKKFESSGKCLVGDDECPKTIDASAQGNLQILAKLRAPFDKMPVDVSLILGGTISTGRTDYYGLWVRDPMLLNIKDTTSNGTARPISQDASTYTNGGSMFKVGGAVTLDLNRLRAEIPLLFHFNYFYRMTLGASGPDYPKVQSLSAALEWTPSRFISLMGEYYMDMPSGFPKLDNDEEDIVSTSTLTFGTALHFSKYVDLQLGIQMLAGGADEYIDNLTIPMNGKMGNGDTRYATYNAAIIPKYMAFGGLVFKIFTAEPEEEEEEEVRNPDTDGDGVCDPWVARESRQREFARYCSGIDLCPYEEGPPGNKGCPEEEDGEAPTIIFNVDQESVSAGQTVTLSWVVTNANEVNIEGLGSVSLKGSKRVRPSETTKYTLTATGDGGTKTETIEVAVESAPGPSIIFNASPESIQKGQLVTLTWMVSEATEVNIEGIGKVSPKGTKKVKPSDAGVTTFTLTATGAGGTKTESIEVEVLSGPLPTILFNASSESVQAGQMVTLNWQTTNATEVSISGIGTVPVKGTKKVKPTENTVYTLTATGENGTQTATVEVEIEEAPPIEAKVNLQGVTFGSGNATLTPNAKKVLDGIAEQLLASPNVKIEIQGHTDNVGNPKSNQELSERRAKAVVGYLALKGVKMSRMQAVGYGQDTPIADNKTAEGRELNRRIEMIRIDN